MTLSYRAPALKLCNSAGCLDIERPMLRNRADASFRPCRQAARLEHGAAAPARPRENL